MPAMAEAAPAPPGVLWWALGGGAPARAPHDEEAARVSLAALRDSRGEPLPTGQAARFGSALGTPLEGVRIHTDAAAERAADAAQARALTTGRDVYFARGEYRPGTFEGDRLLAHELTHVAQETASPSSGAPRLSQPHEAREQAAAAAESRFIPSLGAQLAFGAQAATPRDGPPAQGALLQRQVRPRFTGTPAIDLYFFLRERAAREDVVELQGRERFTPNPDLHAYIAHQGSRESPVPVNVRFGDLATGVARVFVDDAGHFQTAEAAKLALGLRGLGREATSSAAMLVLDVLQDQVSGVFGGVDEALVGATAATVAAAIRNDGAARLLRFGGLERTRFGAALGELRQGRVTLPAARFDFELAGVFSGQGSLDIRDATVTFEADANLRVPGLDEAALHLARNESGDLTGSARLAARLAGFDGTLLASFGRGVLDVRGTARYTRAGFEGSVTLMVTDSASAWGAVDGALREWNSVALAPQAAGESALSGPPAGATSGAAPASRGSDLVVAGWGLVDFRYKDWLHGRAQVIVDPAGDVTSLGRVHLPRSIRILEPKSFRTTLVDRVGDEFQAGSIWAGTVAVYLGAHGSVQAAGSIGPLLLNNLHAAGAFSTRPGFLNHLVIGGRLDLRAGLSVTLTLAGYVAVKAQVPVLGHVSERFRYEIARTQLTLTGTGEIEADASAEAAIHRTQPSGGGEAEYLLNGRLSAGGTATVSFGGALDVRVPGHTFHVLDFAGRRWHLGSLRGSVPFRNFRLGDQEPPALNAAPTSIPVRSLISGIVRNSGVPDTPGERDASATWMSTGATDAVAEAPNATPPVISPDPRFGTQPPSAPPDPQGPAPQPASGGSVETGTADAGTGGTPEPAPVDAGVPPIAGVPDQPEPVPEAPPEQPAPGEVEVPFDMEGTRHHLALTPGDPPQLVMASTRGRLTMKIERHFHLIDMRARDDAMRRVNWQPQLDALDQLLGEARQVEAQAEALGFGERFHGDVPGLRALADHLHQAAHQFDWHDLVGFLPSDPAPAPPQPGEEPLPPTAQQVLGRPFPEFLTAVDAMQPAEALPYLREQRSYYEQELRDVNAYLASGARAERNSTTYQDASRRNRELAGRLREIDFRIRRLSDVVRPDGRPTLPCFAPETPVATPHGPRAIGSLQAGDAVWSCDAAGRAVVGRVEAVHRNLTLRFVRVSVDGQTLRATGRHPFWVDEAQDWIAAEDLRAGLHLCRIDGSLAPIQALEVESVTDAPTVDLSITPHPTYFVGPGVRVHNTPPTRHYQWRDASGASAPSGAFKIYLGSNSSDPEWNDCIYVGQTEQSRSKREADHRAEAERWLAEHASTANDDPEKRYYRFKQRLDLAVIADGLLNVDQADWLEQRNIDHERRSRPLNKVMNRRNELKTTGPAVEARLRADRLVRASGYCP